MSYQQMQMDGVRVPEAETFDQKGQFLIKNWASWGNYRLSQTQANGFSIRKQTNGEHPWIGTFNGHRADGFDHLLKILDVPRMTVLDVEHADTRRLAVIICNKSDR